MTHNLLQAVGKNLYALAMPPIVKPSPLQSENKAMRPQMPNANKL